MNRYDNIMNNDNHQHHHYHSRSDHLNHYLSNDNYCTSDEGIQQTYDYGADIPSQQESVHSHHQQVCMHLS
ncbi:unnamed protein product [Dracunculus medinensis]|uniref:GATA zinc finger domain-containing protein 14-like n=1 Tax=Dracunculus medinensis TaxID=318479 RepID=A0A0N4U1C9_DRAME|nr:unnamed protein product [Dracunculus medinensis]